MDTYGHVDEEARQQLVVAEVAPEAFVKGERWHRSPELKQLTAALALATLEIETPVKDRVANVRSEKGNYSYTYSDLATVLDAIRRPLAKQGLVLVQHPHTIYTEDGAWVEVESVLLHKSGEWMSNTLVARLPDHKPQTLGSLTTYLRRYGAPSLVGIATEQDDDASAPQGVAEHTTTAPTPKTASRAISAAQLKYLLVEMGKAKIGNPRLLEWYAKEFGMVPKLDDIQMGNFDAVLAWVRGQAGKPVSARAETTYGDDE